MEEKKDIPRLKTPGHSVARKDDPEAVRAPANVAMLAIVVVGILALGKLAAGILISSVALLSEGLHTLLDLFAAIVSYFTVRAAGEPADYEHRYGHGKIENVAGIAQAAFIFVPTAIIIYRAVLGIINLETVLAGDGADIGTWVMGATIIVNIFLALRLMGVARKHRSEAIRAAAYHQFNDLWTSIGVFVALALIWWKPEWKILDPVVALAVTAISIWMAWGLFKVSLERLLDRAAGPEIDQKIIQVLDSKKPQVRGYHNLRTRIAGSTIYVDLHVELCGELSFIKEHEIIEELESEIANALDGSDVIIHADPCAGDCDECELDPDAQRAL
jgi:cation diffusion facilitator family transporter